MTFVNFSCNFFATKHARTPHQEEEDLGMYRNSNITHNCGVCRKVKRVKYLTFSMCSHVYISKKKIVLRFDRSVLMCSVEKPHAFSNCGVIYLN